MAVPRISDDGSKAAAYQVGAEEIVRPFANRGDSVSWESHRKYRVQQDRYVRAPIMTQLMHRFGRMYLVDEKTNPIGSGLLELDRTYASLPVTRDEGGSTVWTLQILIADETSSVEEVPMVMACVVRYEYFLQLPPPIISPKVFTVAGIAQFIGGWGRFRPGQIIPAEDSSVDVYKGGIYERRTVYVRMPSGINNNPSNP